MKKIKLTQGKYAIVDDEDFDNLNRFKWYAHRKRNSSVFYAAGRPIMEDGRRKWTRMHSYLVKSSVGMQTDHRNGNGLDNKRKNLRAATHGENIRNRGKTKRNTSGFKGVYRIKGSKKWRAAFYDKKYIHLGCFEDKASAAKAYDNAAKKLHGEFANLNFK
jgi:hypothetical protein